MLTERTKFVAVLFRTDFLTTWYESRMGWQTLVLSSLKLNFQQSVLTIIVINVYKRFFYKNTFLTFFYFSNVFIFKKY